MRMRETEVARREGHSKKKITSPGERGTMLKRKQGPQQTTWQMHTCADMQQGREGEKERKRKRDSSSSSKLKHLRKITQERTLASKTVKAEIESSVQLRVPPGIMALHACNVGGGANARVTSRDAHTFYREHILYRTQYREHSPQRTHSIETTFYREHIAGRMLTHGTCTQHAQACTQVCAQLSNTHTHTPTCSTALVLPTTGTQ